MKNRLIILTSFLATNLVMADYSINLPLTRTTGGLMSNESIIIKTKTTTVPELPVVKEEWAAATPIYSEWTNTNKVPTCDTWTPTTNSVEGDKEFTQQGSTCIQEQSRTKQEREQEKNTLAYRNIGSVQIEVKNINIASATRESIGTKECSYVYGTSTVLSAWVVGPDNAVAVWWKGSQIGSFKGLSITYKYNGYIYDKQASRRDSTKTHSYYKVCRQIL